MKIKYDKSLVSFENLDAFDVAELQAKFEKVKGIYGGVGVPFDVAVRTSTIAINAAQCHFDLKKKGFYQKGDFGFDAVERAYFQNAGAYMAFEILGFYGNGWVHLANCARLEKLIPLSKDKDACKGVFYYRGGGFTRRLKNLLQKNEVFAKSFNQVAGFTLLQIEQQRAAILERGKAAMAVSETAQKSKKRRGVEK